MGLLHKNLILAGIASIAMAGFLGSSSALALGDGAVKDDSQNRQGIGLSRAFFANSPGDNAFLLSSGLIGSFAQNIPATSCTGSENMASVSCNTSRVNYSIDDRGDTMWLHGGDGFVFTDKNLTSPDGGVTKSQLAVAKAADTLNYSFKIDTENYSDELEDKPIVRYNGVFKLPKGLALKAESIVVKVADRILTPSGYSIERETTDEHGYYNYFGLSETFRVVIDWAEYTSEITSYGQENNAELKRFIYSQGDDIEILFSAAVEHGTDSNLTVMAECAYEHISSHQVTAGSATIDSFRFATAIISNTLNIKRVDASGNPIKGEKFTVEGVRASRGNGLYIYDEKGGFHEFETDADGQIIISGLPEGDYTVSEMGGAKRSITKHVSHGQSSYLEYSAKYYYTDEKIAEVFMNQCVEYLDDGTPAYDEYSMYYSACIGSSKAIYGVEELDGQYRFSIYQDGELVAKKDNGAYYLYSVYDVDFAQPLAELTYNADKDIYENVRMLSDMTEYDHAIMLRIIDGTMYFARKDGESVALEYDAASDTYSGYAFGENLTVYKQGDVYYATFDADGTELYMTFEYEEDTDSYVYDRVLAYYAIDEHGDGGVTLKLKGLLSPAEYLDADLISVMGFGVPIYHKTIVTATLSTEFLFGDTGVLPDQITNPQTSDAVLKAVVIATIGLAPIFILRKQLDKRTN